MVICECFIELGVEVYLFDCKFDYWLGDVVVELIGQEMIVFGWVDVCCDYGGVIFVDFFDWIGVCQLVMECDIMGVDSLCDFCYVVFLGDYFVVIGIVGVFCNGMLSLEMMLWWLVVKLL